MVLFIILVIVAALMGLALIVDIVLMRERQRRLVEKLIVNDMKVYIPSKNAVVSDRKYRAGQIVQHYKTRDIYVVLAVARYSEDPDVEHVVYASTTTGKKWHRNGQMFAEDITLDDGSTVPRFAHIGNAVMEIRNSVTFVHYKLFGIGSGVSLAIGDNGEVLYIPNDNDMLQ